VKTKSITPFWGFLAMLAAFPVTGAICAICYHSASMFNVSLIAVPIAAVVFPVVGILMNLLPLLVLRVVGFIVLRIQKLFSKKR
jgi:hypothetical protein